jgi:hypothetical protein
VSFGHSGLADPNDHRFIIYKHPMFTIVDATKGRARRAKVSVQCLDDALARLANMTNMPNALGPPGGLLLLITLHASF